MKTVRTPKQKIVAPIGSHEGKLVVMGSDHKGVALKRRMKTALRRRGWRVIDVGTGSGRRVDYPVFATRIARRVGRTSGHKAVGIGICSTGIGMSIVAAKIPNVLPANPRTAAAARETRTHNNTNFLSLAAGEMTFSRALKITEAWLTEPFFTNPTRDRAYLKRYLQTINLDRQRR